MSPSERDVVIVGGGPAGLATAIEARQRGLDVLVVDRRRPPLDKPCGEGLMPDGLARLAAMGVSVGGRPFDGIRYVDGSVVAEAEFPGSRTSPDSDQGLPACGLGVRRTELHRGLVQRAGELGVDLAWGMRVESVDPARGEVRTLGPRGGTQRHRGRFLVGADGLRSPIRGEAGLGEPRPRSSRVGASVSDSRRFGVRRHFRLRPWTRKVEVHWSDRAEAYVTPVGDEEVGVAILWSGGKGSFEHWLGAFPALERRLVGAETTSNQKGTGPLHQRVRGVVRGRLALVGDAAGYVDAITGEGLSVAFHQAAALGDALAGGDLRPYGRHHARIVRLPDAMTRLLLFVERRPHLRRRVVRALAREPRLFRQFLAVHCRSAPAWTLGRQAPRLLWNLAAAG